MTRGEPDWSSGDGQGAHGAEAREPEEVRGRVGPICWVRIRGRWVGWLIGLDRWVLVIDY
jgi:hypothetical protein